MILFLKFFYFWNILIYKDLDYPHSLLFVFYYSKQTMPLFHFIQIFQRGNMKKIAGLILFYFLFDAYLVSSSENDARKRLSIIFKQRLLILLIKFVTLSFLDYNTHWTAPELTCQFKPVCLSKNSLICLPPNLVQNKN